MKNRILKILLGIIIVPTLSVLAYMGYLTYLAPKPPETLAYTETEEVESEPQSISAEGKVVPNQYAQLSFKSPGLVQEVRVEQGDHVESGQVIAELDGHDQVEASVAAARLELVSAEQAIDELYEHMDLRRAEAQLAVIEMQDQVDDAERILRALTTPASQAQIKAAGDAVSVAERNRDAASKRADSLKNKPEGNPERVAAELALYAAERQYQTTVNYQNAIEGEADEAEIAKAETRLEIAQVQLAEAERELEILEDGPDPDEVTLAEARLDHAKAQLAAAEAALDDLNLVAPFSGDIISLNLKAGEVANPGVPGVILADLSSWYVDTIDLTEVDVSQIAPGMEANITLNAFTDQTFTGVVKEIDLQGVERRGTVTYRVRLDFDPKGTPLRMEMSAFVEILLP